MCQLYNMTVFKPVGRISPLQIPRREKPGDEEIPPLPPRRISLCTQNEQKSACVAYLFSKNV